MRWFLARAVDATDEDEFTRKDEFISVEMKSHGGSASMGLFIFFVQTFALILQESALFGSLSIVNFDTDAAIKQCTAPFTFTER